MNHLTSNAFLPILKYLVYLSYRTFLPKYIPYLPYHAILLYPTFLSTHSTYPSPPTVLFTLGPTLLFSLE